MRIIRFVPMINSHLRFASHSAAQTDTHYPELALTAAGRVKDELSPLYILDPQIEQT